MDDRTIGILLHVWTLVAVSIGSALIIISSSTVVVTASAVLIMIGLASLMPAFRYYWWASEPAEESDAETGAEPE